MIDNDLQFQRRVVAAVQAALDAFPELTDGEDRAYLCLQAAVAYLSSELPNGNKVVRVRSVFEVLNRLTGRCMHMSADNTITVASIVDETTTTC